MRWSPFRAASRIAPALTAAVLICAAVAGNMSPGAVQGIEEYFADVRAEIEKLPYGIATWVGVDTEVPAPAVRLLRPNKIVQRHYTDTSSGDRIDLLVEHCGDVRDMLGHYPPKCYPANGWQMVDIRDASIRLTSGSFPAKRYRFERVADGAEQKIEILGFFVIPGEGVQIYSDMDAINNAAQSAARAGMGAAQVQLLSSDVRLEGDAGPSLEFLRALEPAIRVIAAGVEHER